jgi:DNA-binding response OmpR family regulator
MYNDENDPGKEIMSTQKKILVVEDDPVNLEFFQLMLSKLGFIVEEAGDGLDALEKLKKFQPDLILLDNIMPRMSGWELTKNLKSNPKYNGIPIIMFSALDDVKDKVAGFELGIDDYITKPFNFSEVLARIKTALRNRELFAQIEVRETRLQLAEDLNQDMRQNLSDFVQNIDALDTTVSMIPVNGDHLDQNALIQLIGTIQEKSKIIRRHVADLDNRIEKTMVEWENLKKNEIGLPVLETQIRKILNQEQ